MSDREQDRADRNRKAQTRASARRGKEDRDRRAERIEAARGGKPLIEQCEDCVTEGRVEFRMDGRLVGYAQRSEASMADRNRGKMVWYGSADLPNRHAGSSGKKDEVVSTVKRQLKEAYNGRISIRKPERPEPEDAQDEAPSPGPKM